MTKHGLLKFLSSSSKISILWKLYKTKLFKSRWLAGVAGSGTMEILALASGWDDCTVLWCFAEVIREDNRGQGVRLQSFASLVTGPQYHWLPSPQYHWSTVHSIIGQNIQFRLIMTTFSSTSGHSPSDQRCWCMMISGWWCTMMRPITGWSSTASRHQPARQTV